MRSCCPPSTGATVGFGGAWACAPSAMPCSRANPCPMAPSSRSAAAAAPFLPRLAGALPAAPDHRVGPQPGGVGLHAPALRGAVAPVRADLHHLPFEAEAARRSSRWIPLTRGGALGGGLAEARRVLRPGGLLLLRVSAYPWLLGPHDRAFGTGRRYAAATIDAGPAPAPASRCRPDPRQHPAAASRHRRPPGATARGGRVEEQLDTPAPLNFLFKALLQAEARWLRQRDLPVGLSLYAVARKRVAATGGGHEGSDA